MERRYEEIEVIGPYEKSASEYTKNPIRSKARLTSKLCGTPRDRERSKHRAQEIKRLALLGTRAAFFAHAEKHSAGKPDAGLAGGLFTAATQPAVKVSVPARQV